MCDISLYRERDEFYYFNTCHLPPFENNIFFCNKFVYSFIRSIQYFTAQQCTSILYLISHAFCSRLLESILWVIFSARNCVFIALIQMWMTIIILLIFTYFAWFFNYIFIFVRISVLFLRYLKVIWLDIWTIMFHIKRKISFYILRFYVLCRNHLISSKFCWKMNFFFPNAKSVL